MLKKLLLFVMSLCFCMLCGCTLDFTYKQTSTGVDIIQKTLVPVSMTAESPGKEYVKETIDGVEYWVLTDVSNNNPYTEGSSDAMMGYGYCYQYLGESKEEVEQSEEQISLNITIVMNEEIVKTNGVLSEDKKTVTWKKLGEEEQPLNEIYAFTQTGLNVIASDKTAPLVTGIKNNKCYSNMPTISVSDTLVYSMSLNGVDSRASEWYEAELADVLKQGKNVLVVTDYNGNATTVTFYYDTEKPVVKGIKDKKTYKGKKEVYIKDKVSGIKKVTDNGKKVKNSKLKNVKKGKYKGYRKYIIAKKGKHTLKITDEAGNVKKVTIRIR